MSAPAPNAVAAAPAGALHHPLPLHPTTASLHPTQPAAGFPSSAYTSDATYPVAGGAFPPPPPCYYPSRPHASAATAMPPPPRPQPAACYPPTSYLGQPLHQSPNHPNSGSTSSTHVSTNISTHGGSSSSGSSSCSGTHGVSGTHCGHHVKLGRLVAHSVGGLARGVLTVGAAGLTAAAARVDKALVRVEERHARRAERKAANKRIAC
ncbi:hypothetical protein HXX76_015175 [Chlamydomonas incerta]|uniref:Uncharacterized protein n=1 Tax=Chlamydomonas incerta TaxID=51695 RepID=A0A835VRY9_CHLIN|nr:hypothetical protein HXX76_015175 [Chlamydomonas incerta]|eukprot:KAG2423658.1 hypothetical protein HXX76_015175 [Chlamydomonas incerta]